jgi:Plasmid encoded RepA protein
MRPIVRQSADGGVGVVLDELHRLIEEEGRAVAIARGVVRRPVVEAASGFLGDEMHDPSFVYSGWCLASLPHRRLPDNADWRIENGPAILVVEPGRILRQGRGGAADEFLGVPYGTIARLILIYLQREAIRTGSREVEVGGSMRAWLGLLGMSVGGKTMQLVRDQVRRVSTCRFTLQMRAEGAVAIKQAAFVEDAVLFDLETVADNRQACLFPEVIRLSEAFWRQLRDHPVPLDEAALRQLRRSSMALDIYLWLAYRLRALRGPTPVPWPALRQQFGGGGYAGMFTFRQQFREALELALAVYPEAARRGVKVTQENLTMLPCNPPILPRS